ncbi:MAG: SDR family oxidoreductase, partial [Fimbriimonadaceae bacterium]|nr:SDR family oxidoreductase [Alphaproteobacteria bacterium]
AAGAVAAGAAVCLADILEDRGRALANELAGNGGRVEFVSLDLGDPESVQTCADCAVDALGGLDGLINNGAIATGIGGKSMEDIDIETWDRVMNINIRGTWLMTRAAIPHLKKSNAPRILNIASDTALWGAPVLMHYVASKGAIIAMTRSMARELGPDNVAVNAIAPGLTVGEATEYVPADRHQFYANGRAMKRSQVADDVVGPALFFLSNGAGFVTGQVLPVNGGFVFN